MAIANWEPGKIYLPGALVIPTSVSGAIGTVIPNADFEGGDADWTKGTGWAINANSPFSGTNSAEYSGPGAANLISDTKHPVEPGKAITAKCFVSQGASDDGQANAAVILRWYDSLDALISDSVGNSVSSGDVGVWRASTVSGIAPPGAAKVAIGASAYNDWAALYVDNFQWNYVTGGAVAPLAYRVIGRSTGPQTDIAFVDSNPDTITRLAGSFLGDGFISGEAIEISGSVSNDGSVSADSVSALIITLITTDSLVAELAGATVTLTGAGAAGVSGATEPDWPTVVGQTVVDNEITWEAVTIDSVTWEATSVLTSGSSEPTWPTGPGDIIADGNIAWETTPLRIEDENCPHTKVVAIAASKVFAGDTDKVRFCATLNARDWTTEQDAGFLPSGLQQKGEVGVTAMGVYRGNLAVWSPSTFQIWQVDPDPAAMAMLDAMEGIGSMNQQAVQPVSDDLFFLAALGVRTVSIAEGTNNLSSADTGVPIDPLIQAEVNQVDVEPIATYYPSAGQYWLAFRPLTIAATLLAGQFLITSPPYPIEGMDELTWSATITGGTSHEVLKDEMEFTATPLDSTLEAIFLQSGVPVDEMEFSATPLDSIMEDILLVSEVMVDEMEFTATPLDSTLELALVTHDQPNEGMDWNAEVTGGTIT